MSMRDAGDAAKGESGADINASSLPCSLDKKYERICIEILGADRCGVEGIALVLTNVDGDEQRTKTSTAGLGWFNGLEAGMYRLSLPALDQDAWELMQMTELSPAVRCHEGSASWNSPREEASVASTVHTSKQGECVSKIAERYGFDPKTLWDHPGNSLLRQSRDTMYILAAGDRILIPSMRVKTLDGIASGTHLLLERKGVPERLQIRFLDPRGKARNHLPYILQVTVNDGELMKDIAGETDAAGFVRAWVAPAATTATISLFDNGMVETQLFQLGYVDPLHTISGWQDRLTNLGFCCGDQRGELTEQTRSAIAAFQRSHLLPATAVMDAATESELLAASLS
jgi:peptidoglycan hydrolase-like protein with peptidoglycan-binding domain